MQALPHFAVEALARNLESFPGLKEVAEVALFLAAFETNALTGQSLCVSHGWHMV